MNAGRSEVHRPTLPGRLLYGIDPFLRFKIGPMNGRDAPISVVRPSRMHGSDEWGQPMAFRSRSDIQRIAS